MAKDIGEQVKEAMTKPTRIRNIAIAAHIDHGKTTLSDNLLSGAGMISEELAGKQRFMDFHDDEAERGITIDSANVSMVHKVEGQEYLINLIDTPGHVDFGGDVMRAMRAVDGAVVLSCAVEGIMPQTETVMRQALKEFVKPILFINKADRLIKELKLTPEMMQEKFVTIINKLNELIEKIAPKEFKQKWKVNVADGSVCFGSAYSNWALSVPFMQKKGIKFSDIIEAYDGEDNQEAIKALAKKAPLHEVLLDSVIQHLPNPVDAQRYRIPNIWKGELDSQEGQDLVNANVKGNPAMVVTKIVQDKHAGEVCTGRLFSGTIKKGDSVVANVSGEKGKVQQVFVSKGPQRVLISEAVAGNIIGITGIKNVNVGETISMNPITPFENIQNIFEPVVTTAVEAKKPAELPKLIEILRVVGKEDPSLVITINEETGEHLISGMGELHLEVVTNRIKTEKGLDINVSPPIVVYRESVSGISEQMEGKSPNKHNKFYITVEPLEEEFAQALMNKEISDQRVKKKNRELWDSFIEKGLPKAEAESVKDIYNGNVFIDETRGIVALGEIMELILDSFEEVMRGGPLAREPCVNLKVRLKDAKLHEDSIHRGPGQVYPAIREGLRDAVLGAKPVIYEPLQIIQIDAPQDSMGPVSTVIQNRRGVVLDMEQFEDTMSIMAKIPVAESFGLTGDMRSATGGKGSFFVKSQTFEALPRELQDNLVKQVRQRKGLSDNQ